MRGAGGFFAALKSCPSPHTRSAAPAGRVEIRAAREADLTQIAAIWNYEVLGTDATTDTEPRDPLAQRVVTDFCKHPIGLAARMKCRALRTF